MPDLTGQENRGTMKAICKARNWPHAPNATAKPLTVMLECADEFIGRTVESGLMEQ
jgi:hypothetical protein